MSNLKAYANKKSNKITGEEVFMVVVHAMKQTVKDGRQIIHLTLMEEGEDELLSFSFLKENIKSVKVGMPHTLVLTHHKDYEKPFKSITLNGGSNFFD